MRIAVIGTGAAGAQVLWQLSQRDGIEVEGFDLHTPGHGLGASGGDGRVFRTVQYEDPAYVPLLKRSDFLWRELEREVGRPLRVINRGLIIGTSDAPQIRTSLRGIELHGLDCEVLEAGALRTRFPQQRFHEDDLGIVDNGAGTIFPELTNLLAVDAAVNRGARMHPNTRVQAIEADATGVDVVAADRRRRFDKAVVASGAWVRQLAPELGSLVQPRKVLSAWFYPRDADRLADLPPFVRVAPTHYYGVPSGDRLSIKLGLSGAHHRDVDSPDDADYVVRQENWSPFTPMLEEYFPGIHPHPYRTEIYFEGYTRDARPIMQPTAGSERVIVTAGFSGHGFKFAPVIGQIGAALAADGEIDDDIQFLQRDSARP
ncbi:FAD-dependent oxidoreductase [Glycomyces tenuis]|uniref:FAD-dependent oxidoreductase n=1 Tax=Glycomyces tenuis TaxID=58116 RepID=UPI0004168009|nr:FAD-dependent oxidoreductase [Glycomyces tenuis]